MEEGSRALIPDQIRGFCWEQCPPSQEFRREEGSYRRRRRAGKSEPRLSADDCEGAWTYVDHRNLLRARGNGILALAADVPGNSDADRVLSRPRHPH